MNQFIHTWTRRLALGWALGLGLMLGFVPLAAAHPAAQAAGPAAVVDAYLAADNNPDAQLNLVTDDVTLRIVPPPPGTPGVWSGKDQARGFFEFGKSQNDHVELVGSWQVSGDHVSGTVLVTVNDFRNWNVGAVQHQYDFVVQGGKVKSWTGTMAEFERPRVQAAAQAYAAAHPAPASPGMPATGGAGLSFYAMLLALAGLAILGGVRLRLRRGV
jgi:hypothetical protein